MKKPFVKRIKVEGGCITVNLITFLQVICDFEKTVEAIKPADGRETGEMEIRKILAGKFERIFGRGSCRKTFGTDIPSLAQISEFLDKLEPLLKGWMDEIGKKTLLNAMGRRGKPRRH